MLLNAQVHVFVNLTLLWITKERHLSEFENLERREEECYLLYLLNGEWLTTSVIDESSFEAVKVKLPEITSLFREFAEAQHAALTDEGQRQ